MVFWIPLIIFWTREAVGLHVATSSSGSHQAQVLIKLRFSPKARQRGAGLSLKAWVAAEELTLNY